MAVGNRIELKARGMKQLLRSKEVADDIANRAGAVAARAGAGFVVDASVGKNRARASVYAGTFAARRAEARSRVLLSAVDAAR